VRYIYSNHYKVPEGKRAIELLSGKEGIISQMMPYQHVKAALNLVCYKLFRWSCLLVRWSPSVTTAKNAFTRVASVARLEKDFGKNFVALLSDLIHETFFTCTHFNSSKNLDCTREDSSENSLCNNVFYTGIILLCTHNRFYTKKMCLA